jgi:RimJ/RimL family protein N-acetyltransferase
MKNKFKITIRNFDIKDIDKNYIDALNNKKLMKFSENRFKSFNRKSCLDYYRAMKLKKNYFFLILKNDLINFVKIPIGTMTCYIDHHNKSCDLGILIWEAGKGYGNIAWKLAIKKIFTDTRIRKITAGAMENNVAMIKIFKNSGMKFELRKKKNFLFKNKYTDMIGYCIFKNNY